MHQLALSLLIGLICFLFLLVFRPFGLDEVKDITFIFGFGAISSVVLLFHYFLFPRISVRYFNAELWTIWKQLTLFSSIIFLTGIGIYIYNSTIGFNISPQYSLGKFLYIAFAVGVLPMIIMTYFIEKVAAQRNRDLAKSIAVNREVQREKLITIKSDNLNEEDLELKISNFLYAKANGNYTDVICLVDNKVDNFLIRASLKSIQDQLVTEDQILRCHKSYLVNKNHITAVKGNARSLLLELSQIEDEIPVSRSIPKSAFG